MTDDDTGAATPETQVLMTPAQAADLLGIDQSTLARWRKKGREVPPLIFPRAGMQRGGLYRHEDVLRLKAKLEAIGYLPLGGTSPDADEYISLLEAADLLGVSDNTLRRWQKKKYDLPEGVYTRKNGRWVVRYRRADFLVVKARLAAGGDSYRTDLRLQDDEWLQPLQVADFLGVTTRTLARWREKDRGPRFYDLLGAARYRKSDVLAFQKAKAGGETPIAREEESHAA